MGAEPGAEDYPRTPREFEDRFRTEADGSAYRVALRGPQGFVCPACKGHAAWRTSRDRVECAACHAQRSLTAGTIFHETHKPLRLWCRAMGRHRVLGLGSDRTAWTWLHKLRRAMGRPERDRRSGTVEVDETFVGGVDAGEDVAMWGRRPLWRSRRQFAAGRLVAFGCGASVTRRPTVSAHSCRRPSCRACGGDRWVAYRLGAPRMGIPSRAQGQPRQWQPRPCGEASGPRVASLLDRWWLGTYQGALRPQHRDDSLDAFTFRFNRRTSRSRGKLCSRWVQQAAAIPPTPYQALVGGRPRQNRS